MGEAAKLPLAERLVKGAAVMGRLWREGKRCAMRWKFGCICEDAAKSEFCKAKAQWGKLFVESGRDAETASDFEIIDSMTSGELNATGLTLTLEVAEVGKIKVGPKGDASWEDFCKLNGQVLPTVLTVLKAFPGAKVV